MVGDEGEQKAPLEVAERRAEFLGRLVKESMPKGWGYVLVLARDGDTLAIIISDLEKAGAARMLRDVAAKLERGETV